LVEQSEQESAKILSKASDLEEQKYPSPNKTTLMDDVAPIIRAMSPKK
jgi:hypothetical protein